MSHYFENDESLKSEMKRTTFHIRNREYLFYTDHGIFSKKGLDFGTRALLETIPFEMLTGNILDLGCGAGPIGICIKKEVPNVSVDMVDINLRALKLAKKNAVENKVEVNIFESNGYENITQKYDYIITNPPIRVGKKILYQLLQEAKEHLTEDGELWFVIHKDQGAKSTVKEMQKYYQVEVKNKTGGFFIIRAGNN